MSLTGPLPPRPSVGQDLRQELPGALGAGRRTEGAVEVAVAGRKIKLGPGDFFGEMALLSGAPRSADVTAIDYCQFLTLDPRDFQLYLQSHADVRERGAADGCTQRQAAYRVALERVAQAVRLRGYV